MRNCVFILGMMVVSAICPVACEAMGTGYPSVKELTEALTDSAKQPSRRWRLFASALKRMHDYKSGVNTNAVSAAEAFVLSNVLGVAVAGVRDCDLAQFDLLGMKMCMMEISSWPSMRISTNQVMRVADDLSRYVQLPDLRSTDAVRHAYALDNLVLHGTNANPRGADVVANTNGAVVRIRNLMSFRSTYNESVRKFRQWTLSCFCDVILVHGFKDREPADRQMLWREFVRRAKASAREAEIAEQYYHETVR